ncbi:MAG: trigger factor [Calditrichaeota bacterium]|nr:trigger factor [Calditrichota bacterium]MCB9368728.1 trigger factor [Calditrichota bacterium]
MDISVENSKLNDVQVELKVAVPAEFMKLELERNLSAVASQAKFPGFRPGKVPRNVVVQRFGPAVTEDTVQRVLQDAYRSALDQEKIYPISPGEMSEIHFEPGQPLTFKVIVEILPEIALPELSEVEVELKEPQADETDVDTAIDSLRESQAVLVPSENPVNEHSVITFDLQELDESGVAIVGRSQKDVSVDMSRQQFGEEFASKVTGVACDQSVNVSFRRSDESNQAPLHAQLTIRNIQQKELPELDDEFAKSVNPNLESLDDLRRDMKNYIEARAGHAAKQQMFRALAEELMKRTAFEVPPRMLENYLDRMVDEAAHNSKNKPDPEALKKFREDYRPSATWTLRWYLLRNKLIQDFGLRATNEEIDQELATLATVEDELLDDFRKRLTPDQFQQINDDVQERKVLSHLENNVKLSRVPVSLAEFEGRTEPSKIVTD